MSNSLAAEFQSHQQLSTEGQEFLKHLEKSIAQDLWQSAGGHWSSESIEFFRKTAMAKLSEFVRQDEEQSFPKAWESVVRDFHGNQCWGETRLLKKEIKPKTEEQKTFWELFSYIWILVQAMLITKTAVFYLGIKAAEEGTSEGQIYVTLALVFSVLSLSWFGYRKYHKKPKD
ncbi:hypothetical protein ACES2L_12405 [Bdellovibrio bacteriovorus]